MLTEHVDKHERHLLPCACEQETHYDCWLIWYDYLEFNKAKKAVNDGEWFIPYKKCSGCRIYCSNAGKILFQI